jgi:hypothetical protein
MGPPERCQPAPRSHVRGGDTGGGRVEAGIRCAQPPNHGAEEQGSTPRTGAVPRSGIGSACFSKFFST